MSDLISRDRLRGELAGTNFNNISDWQKINEIIDRQPDGQKHGHWELKQTSKTWCKCCSYCGYEIGQKHFNYCPHCGALMQEGED